VSNLPRVLFVFPGQGSQYRGMGRDLHTRFASAREVYALASDVLGYDLAMLSFEDPDGQLALTRFTQPALMAHHMACLSAYRECVPTPLLPYATAGHSLGEYSALVAGGALDLEHGLRLVQDRGNLMGSLGEGEMLALPLELDQARPLADEFYCGIGGLNLPAQTVVGGASEDLDAMATAIASRFPKIRPVRLKTEGAFHTYYMVEAAKRFRPILAAAPISSPKVKVLSNYLGDYHEDQPESIKSRLFFQLFHPVNWLGCLERAFADGVDTVIEFGGGIGKGESPQEKRPNLESIVRRAARRGAHDVNYLPAINAATIEHLNPG